MQQTIGKRSPNRQYVSLSAAFDFFNRRLFAAALPPCLITLQRKSGSRGYYSPKRFEGRGDANRQTDEIALNPATFENRTDAQILSTLVHEMVHQWQEHLGRPSRSCYHNQEWADHMEALGLMPTDTGLPGGRRVGQHVTHYILARGAFDLACQELLAGGVQVEWQSRENPPAVTKAKARTKTKYSCPGCGINVWGKSGLHVLCGECDEELFEED